jgi:hypothetical protein
VLNPTFPQLQTKFLIFTGFGSRNLTQSNLQGREKSPGKLINHICMKVGILHISESKTLQKRVEDSFVLDVTLEKG